MDSKQMYQDKIETQLKKWKTRIDSLKTKVERAEAGAKTKLQGQMEGLHEKRLKAEKMLDEVKSSGQEAWENVRAGIEDAWGALSRTTRTKLAKKQQAPVESNPEEEIRQIAYRLWQDEGCPHGRHIDHWLQAESIWRTRQAQQQTAGAMRSKSARPRKPTAVPSVTRRARPKSAADDKEA